MFSLQCVQILTKIGPYYSEEIFVLTETNVVQARSSYLKLNVPCRKTNVGQKTLYYVGPSFWNNLNKTLKTSTSLNAFKHDIKHFNASITVHVFFTK